VLATAKVLANGVGTEKQWRYWQMAEYFAMAEVLAMAALLARMEVLETVPMMVLAPSGSDGHGDGGMDYGGGSKHYNSEDRCAGNGR